MLYYIWPPVILLTCIATALIGIYFFLRYQFTKDKTTDTSINLKEEHQKFLEEIDNLAIYVSHLPRPKNIIKEYRNDDLENNFD